MGHCLAVDGLDFAAIVLGSGLGREPTGAFHVVEDAKAFECGSERDVAVAASGIETSTREDWAKLDRKRPKKGSNQEWGIRTTWRHGSRR